MIGEIMFLPVKPLTVPKGLLNLVYFCLELQMEKERITR